MFAAAPASAQSLGAATGAPWVTATLVSVSAVFALWVTAAGLFSLARRLRWVSPHRHSRLTRGVQVTFGGLLILAALVPYLALNHPLIGVGVLACSMVLAIVLGSRSVTTLHGESNRG